MDGEETDAEDELVDEFDVTIAPSAADLYLLQFPLRPRSEWLGEERRVLGGRVRPKQQRVELSVSMVPAATRSASEGVQSYDATRLAQYQSQMRLAEGAPPAAAASAGGGAANLPAAPGEPAQKLSGIASAGAPAANYMVCHFDAEERRLTVVPLSCCVQMRPTFTHLPSSAGSAAARAAVGDDGLAFAGAAGGDSRSAARRRVSSAAGGAAASGGGDTDHGDTTAGEESGVEAVGVKFRRRESERAEARRLSSHSYLQKRHEEEMWRDLRVVSAPSAESTSARQRVFRGVKAEDGRRVFEPLSAAEYLRQLGPQESSAREGDAAPAPAANLPRPATTRSPLADHFLGPRARHELRSIAPHIAVEDIIRRVRIVSLPTVMEMLGRRDAEALIKYLEPHAFMLRGNWVALRAADELVAPVRTGRVSAAREILLWMLRDQPSIREDNFLSQVGGRAAFDAGVVRALLTETCEHVRGVGWTLRLPDDADAWERFAVIARRHREEHSRRYAAARALLAPSGEVTSRAPPDGSSLPSFSC